MIIARQIQPRIEKHLFKGKAIVIYGPRRVGKTTLVRQIQEKVSDGRYLNCDEPDVRQALTGKTSTELLAFLGKKKLIILDEAQRVPNIGLTLKLLVDSAPKIQILATGSSSFDLSNKIAEALTGRAFEFLLTPISSREITADPLEMKRLIEGRMIYGSYPEIITDPDIAIENIGSIYKNYLFKDALEFQGLKNPELVNKLLQALALQIGSEVHFTELGNLLEIDKATISRYLRLLELAFVVFRLPPLSRNLRKEINKSRKIYFWDNGVRNAIINNFNPLGLRADVGPLWENFLIAERLKRNNILGLTPNIYFWRTWTKQEVDYIEESEGKMSAFEIKWQKGRPRPPKTWKETYPNSTFQLLNKDSFLQFVS